MMKFLNPILKAVGAQALATFIVFNIVVWTICLGFSVYGFFERYGPTLPLVSRSDRMTALPNYAGIGWTRTHFQESHSLRTRYLSYIGWRREPFRGKTITLVGPYAQRAAVGAADPAKPSIYFFGGSTMWGTGSDDANTIPSLVTQIGGYRSQNYGESAWTAHQSLSLLIRLLQEGHRPDVVVFYDGANEVAHKCRRELTPASHAREHQISVAMAAAKSQDTYGLQYMLGPLMRLAKQLHSTLLGRNTIAFDCHENPQKAKEIADNLLQDWDVARRLVESYGGKFVGILQPVAYYSNTKLHHIRLSDIQRRQFLAVYPLIGLNMVGRAGLYDFTTVLDRDEYIYIDFCHVSPNGNRHIAQKLVEVLAGQAGSHRGP